MGIIDAEGLFALWERGRIQTVTGQRRTMLRGCDIPEGALDGLSVGQADTMLMDLRISIFGTEVNSVVACPGCAELLDVSFDLREIRSHPPANPVDPIAICADDYRVEARPPTLEDLRWLEHCSPIDDLRDFLLARCVVAAEHSGAQVDVADLPALVVDRVSAALSEADPQAETRLSLQCGGCGCSWNALFDIVTFLWRELETWVWRTAEDVDTLAARYGWSEADILAMSPSRRDLYLELSRA